QRHHASSTVLSHVPLRPQHLSPHRTFARNFFNRSPEIGELTSRLKANPRFTLLGDTVLIIDEANAFKEADDKSYQRGVKNACHFHLIRLLLRSKFPHYATDIVNILKTQSLYFSSRYHTYLLKHDKDRLISVDFKIPSRMTGGRMFLNDEYVEQVAVSGHFEDPMDFEPTQVAYTTLEDELLGKAKPYDQEKSVGSVGFIHYRPLSRFSRDLLPRPLESVITAQSEPALRAMEAPLKKCGKQ
ncbi:hypothetical protein PSHT_07320, partial [Puccinia striiformis]